MKAAELIAAQHCVGTVSGEDIRTLLEDAFVDLFRNDNPKFDEKRFRQACKEKP